MYARHSNPYPCFSEADTNSEVKDIANTIRQSLKDVPSNNDRFQPSRFSGRSVDLSSRAVVYSSLIPRGVARTRDPRTDIVKGYPVSTCAVGERDGVAPKKKEKKTALEDNWQVGVSRAATPLPSPSDVLSRPEDSGLRPCGRRMLRHTLRGQRRRAAKYKRKKKEATTAGKRRSAGVSRPVRASRGKLQLFSIVDVFRRFGLLVVLRSEWRRPRDQGGCRFDDTLATLRSPWSTRTTGPCDGDEGPL